MPLPRELATPPVTKMCFVTGPQDNPLVTTDRGRVPDLGLVLGSPAGELVRAPLLAVLSDVTVDVTADV